MYDHRTLIRALSQHDPGMTAVESDIARIQFISCLGKIVLIINRSPAPALITASHIAGYHRIAAALSGGRMHYLICRPAYETGAVKTFGPIGYAEVVIILVIIAAVLTVVP